MTKAITEIPQNMPITLMAEDLKKLLNETVEEALLRKNCLMRKDGYLPIKEIMASYKCSKEIILHLIDTDNLKIHAEKWEQGKDGRRLLKNIWVHEKDFVDKYFQHKSFHGATKLRF